MTVGSAYQLSTHHTTPLAETWNGKSWRVVAAPALGSRTQLNAVSCTSAAACEAVGLYDDAKGTTQALAEQWNGTSWAMQAAARPGSSSVLEGVSCTSRSNCVAVGSQSTHATHPLTEWWDGTQWTAVTAPVAPHATGGYLSAVSCTAPHTCTATGTNFRPGGVTLAERWNGATWRVQTTPNPPNWRSSFRSTELDGVSCTSATTCVASGEYAPGGNAAYFIERWNGATWRLETTPRPAGYLHGALLAVSCRASRCAAVGAYTRVSLLQSTLALGG